MAAAEQSSLDDKVSTAIGDSFSDTYVGKVVAAFLHVLSVLGVSVPPMDNLTVSLVQEEDTTYVEGGIIHTDDGSQYVVFKLTLPDKSVLTYKFCAGTQIYRYEDDEDDHEFGSDVLTLCDPNGKPLGSDSVLGTIGEDEEEVCGSLTMSDIQDKFKFYFLCGSGDDFECDFADAVLRIHQYFSKEGLVKTASRSAE